MWLNNNDIAEALLNPRPIVEKKDIKEWSPEKESLIYFEELAKRQKRIYPDAVDSGVLLDTDDGVKTEEARAEIKKLLNVYGGKIVKYHGGSSTEIFIPFEEDEGQMSGVVLSVSYNNDPARKLSFLSIDITRKAMSEKDAKKNYNFKE